MHLPPLSDDEFRLLAFLRDYADRCEQHLEPNWIQDQLKFSVEQMRKAARALLPVCRWARRAIKTVESQRDECLL
jgi:hypothetical protein